MLVFMLVVFMLVSTIKVLGIILSKVMNRHTHNHTHFPTTTSTTPPNTKNDAQVEPQSPQSTALQDTKRQNINDKTSLEMKPNKTSIMTTNMNMNTKSLNMSKVLNRNTHTHLSTSTSTTVPDIKRQIIHDTTSRKMTPNKTLIMETNMSTTNMDMSKVMKGHTHIHPHPHSPTTTTVSHTTPTNSPINETPAPKPSKSRFSSSITNLTAFFRSTKSKPTTSSTNTNTNAISSCSSSHTKLSTCQICTTDSIPSTSILHQKCTHTICSTCLTTLFTVASLDPRLVPKCCTRIHGAVAKPFISPALLKDYRAARKTFKSGPPLYCANKRCSAVLGPMTRKKEAVKCLDCPTKTCGKCKNIAHGGKLCRVGEDEMVVLGVARREGYHQCWKCDVLVERKGGCHKMKCRCGASHCAGCGGEWGREHYGCVA